METIYLTTRKDLTDGMTGYRSMGYTCHRVRLACSCTEYVQDKDMAYHRANQRNGVIVIDGDKVVEVLIRCKSCANK